MPDSALSVLLAAFAAASVPAFHDEEVIIVHDASVPQDKAHDHPHLMIDWDARNPFAEPRSISLWAEEPIGDPDFAVLGSLYAAERLPLTAMADGAARAAANWLAGRSSARTALTALAEWDIYTDERAFDPDHLQIPLPFTHSAWGFLSIADRAGRFTHTTDEHTGWTLSLHDEHGTPIGNPVWSSSNDSDLVDCAEDSTMLAAVVAQWLTSPVSRHCDCYAQETHNQRHDEQCNRYRLPA
ncbi:hypothetical protein [Streptomyces sp. NPDC007088]|uniref:hypothetical protein n=1 Tax=Streptomyces sp. NPDC007088 TaxID=3364773 RepID=UPI0036B80307